MLKRAKQLFMPTLFLIFIAVVCLTASFLFTPQTPNIQLDIKSEETQSEFVPISNYQEVRDNGDGSKTMNILSYPKYYQDENNQWQESDNAFQPSPYPYADWVSEKGVWQLYVTNNGWYARKHLGQAISLRLQSMVLLNKDRSFEVLKTADADSVPTPTIQDNAILWENYFPNINFKITRVEDQFKEEIIFTQQARDQFTQYLKDNNIDITDKQVAFIFQVKLANLDGNSPFTQEILINNQPLNWQEQGIETTGPIYEDIDNKTASYFPEGFVRHQDYDLNNPDNQDPNLITHKLRRFFTQDNQKDYLVGAPVEWLENVKEGNVILNDSVTYDYTVVIDSRISSGSSHVNYGTSETLLLQRPNVHALISWDISLTGVTVTDAWMDLYKYGGHTTEMIHSVYQVLKPWTEDGVS